MQQHEAAAWRSESKQTAKLLLVWLARQADDDGIVRGWTTAAMRRAIGCTDGSLFAALKSLEARGEITRTWSGPNRPNVYLVLVGCDDEQSDDSEVA